MKNKKLNYILIPLAILVWGFIVFEVLSSFKKPAADPVDIYRDESKKMVSIIPDTFSLLLNYNDPFINSPVPKANLSNKAVKKPSKKEEPPKKQPPQITYTGSIVKDKTGEVIGMFRWKNKDVLLLPKQTIDDLELLTLSDDNAVFKWEREKIVIKRTK